MRPASEVERRRLNETFASLCRIRSVSGEEDAVAAWVGGQLEALGVQVEPPDAAGNVLARIASRGAAERPSVLLSAHLDTVAHDGEVDPVVAGDYWVSAGETILGADGKAGVAVLVELARRAAIEGAPVDLELLFTTGQETALSGARGFDRQRLRSTFGFVVGHSGPIGGIVMRSPTCYRVEAVFRGVPARAGASPHEGRGAIVAAARAIAALPHGVVGEGSTVNVGSMSGGVPGAGGIVGDRAEFVAEVRSHDEARAEALVAEIVDRAQDAANDPECACDVDVTFEKLFDGYEHRSRAIGVSVAEDALRACGYTPDRLVSGAATDANALIAGGFPCTNLANGIERGHSVDERIAVAALEGMLDVCYALLDAAALAGAA